MKTPLAGERLRPLGHLSGKRLIRANHYRIKGFVRFYQKF